MIEEIFKCKCVSSKRILHKHSYHLYLLKKMKYFKNEEKSYRKTSGNYINIFSQNVWLEKYKYFHRKEWKGGEAGPVEMFAEEYLTAPWKPTLVSFQRLGKYLWKFTSSVGRPPARLPWFPFFRGHSGFLQNGVSWGDQFCFCSFSLLFAYKLTVFQSFPWETHPGFTLQAIRGLYRKGRRWPLVGWALDSHKLVVGKYWVPWIFMCGFLGKMPLLMERLLFNKICPCKRSALVRYIYIQRTKTYRKTTVPQQTHGSPLSRETVSSFDCLAEMCTYQI